MHASNVTFYQYEGRALDHGWLHNCAGFHALRHGASDRFIQEQSISRASSSTSLIVPSSATR